MGVRLSLIALTALLALQAEAQPTVTTRSPTTNPVLTLRAPAEGSVLIRSGTYAMGSDVDEIQLALLLCRYEPAADKCREGEFVDEFPAHDVTLSDFRIDRLEVTVGDYQRCVEVGPCAAPPLASGGKRFEQAELPVSMVTWNDAATYCSWRGGRLPTEAQWERAARGLTSKRFAWGNTYDPFLNNGGRLGLDPFEDKDGFLELSPVGSFPSGRTPDGVLDLAGNVEEWVADWYNAYPEEDVTDPTGPETGDEKVVRGGSYIHGRAWLRGASRGHDAASARRSWRGFRCAYDAL